MGNRKSQNLRFATNLYVLWPQETEKIIFEKPLVRRHSRLYVSTIAFTQIEIGALFSFGGYSVTRRVASKLENKIPGLSYKSKLKL